MQNCFARGLFRPLAKPPLLLSFFLLSFIRKRQAERKKKNEKRKSEKNKKKRQSSAENCRFFLVPVAGVEPARYRYHWILSPARLPIPSHRQVHCILATKVLYTKYRFCQPFKAYSDVFFILFDTVQLVFALSVLFKRKNVFNRYFRNVVKRLGCKIRLV